MMNFFRISFAFLKRDILESSSYKFSYLFGLAGILGSLIFFFFLNKLITPGQNQYLAAYGGNYFAYVVIGIAFIGYLNISSSVFSGLLEAGENSGTLEAILLTPAKIYLLAFANSFWSFIFTTAHVLIYLLLGVIFFGLDLPRVNIPVLLLVLFICSIPLFLLGVISSALTLATKQSGFINLLSGRAGKFLAGVYFPIGIFPAWLAKLTLLLPLTQGLEAIRKCALSGSNIAGVLPNLIYLIAVSIVLLPISVFSFRWGFKKAKLYGNLVHR